MKSIDVKSLLIGALLTSTIFLGVAATSPTDKWDDKQGWQVATGEMLNPQGLREMKLATNPNNGKKGVVFEVKGGWEPFSSYNLGDGAHTLYRKRIK